MKDQKEKVKEPFSPEETPNPPQIIDPSSDTEQGEGRQPLKASPKNQQREKKGGQKVKSQPENKLNASETGMEDES